MSGERRDVRMSGQAGQAAQKRRRLGASEPAPRYGVLSEVDAEGRVWHYPVVLSLADLSPVALSSGSPLPSAIFFMRPAVRRGAARLPVRFRSRLRAVRFTQEDAELEREMLRELKRMVTGVAGVAGGS